MKHLFAALIILMSVSCQNDTEGYAITGKGSNIEDGTMIHVSQLGPNNQPQKVDSVAIENEQFTLDLPEVDQPNLSFLTIEGLNGNVMYISENEPITFEIYKDSLQASKVSGGKENEVFYTYLNHLKDLRERSMAIRSSMQEVMTTTRDSATFAGLQQEEEGLRARDMSFKKELVEEHPDAFVSILILTDMQAMGAPNSELKELYAGLSNDLKQTPIAQALKENLDKMGAVDIGSTAPAFSGPNPEGEEISLQESLGKVTLIDFWAAWCKPCRQENPNIVRVYEKYHEQGFNVIGVSLDREDQRNRWLQAIEEDNLTWTQISHLQFWDEPIAQLYGIRAIPAAFILDENGVIVAKNLRGDDLENKVKELLEN